MVSEAIYGSSILPGGTMNHKRRRPKHQRGGCLMCKPQKDEREAKTVKNQRPTVRRKLQKSRQEEY